MGSVDIVISVLLPVKKSADMLIIVKGLAGVLELGKLVLNLVDVLLGSEFVMESLVLHWVNNLRCILL